MTRQKFGRLLAMVLMLFVTVGIYIGNQRSMVVAQAATPSADIVNVFGINLSTGFTLQPQDEYTYVGNTKTLTASVGHDVLTAYNILYQDSYQWYQSSDGGTTWKSVSNATASTTTTGIAGATTAALKITPATAGTVYYQLKDQYGLAINPFNPEYYTRVAAVTTVASAINATSLKVSTDDDYLYSNQTNATTTFVHGTPTPADATGDVTWTSSDTSLATVDKTTGQVTANTASKSGTVTITGTLTNADGSTEVGTVDIKVGGGLDDQTVNSGKTATFTVQGTADQTPTSVVWHKVTTSGTDSVVNSGTSLNYTTAATTAADDGSKYYAVVTMTVDGQTETLTTNKATLNVNVDHTPAVSITSKIVDLTDNTGNTDTSLNNVVNGDNAEITGTITDANPDSSLKSGTFLIKLPSNAQNTSVTIDGASANYMPTTVGSDIYLVAQSRISFSSLQTHSFKVDFQSTETTNLSLTTNAELRGYDAATSDNLIDTYAGPDLTINATDGGVSAKAGDVTFGSLSYANVDEEIAGQVSGGGDLLAVTDNRRTKTGTTVSLRQATPFTDGTHTLDATLSYNNGSTLTALTSTNQAVLYAGPGMTLASLNANQGQQLELKLATQAIYPGSYTSTLDWTITTAPS